MDVWYTSKKKCCGCINYTGAACLYDLELEEKEDEVEPGTYTMAEICPYGEAKVED